MRGQAVALTLALVLGSVLGYGQSLAELAKKEKERREKIGQKGRSYGDWDLRGSIPPPLPTESSEEASAPTEEGSAAGSAPAEPVGEGAVQEDPSKTPAYWRERIGKLQQRIAELEGQLGRPGFDQDPTNLSRRQRIERDLAQARTDLEAVVAEGQRKGVPAGWLR